MRTLWSCTLSLVLACTPDKAQEEAEEDATDTQAQLDSAVCRRWSYQTSVRSYPAP